MLENTNEIPNLLTIRQFADKHKFISENTLRWLAWKGELDECTIRLSRRIYVDEKKFFEYLKNNTKKIQDLKKEKRNDQLKSKRG